MISEKTLENMESNGSFARKLVEVYKLADEENKKELEKTFGNYFKKYEKIHESMISEQTLRNMLKHGGSFVKRLAELYIISDYEDREKLKENFEDYFKKYENY